MDFRTADPEILEKRFVYLVSNSWKRYDEIYRNKHLDEVLIGAVITSNVDEGYSLIDLNSTGVNHYLRFENLSDRTRLIFSLNNMSEDIVYAKVLGHLAKVTIGYGEKVNNIGHLWQTLKAEMKSSFITTDEPGIITCDADMMGGYIYAQVPLIMDLDKYLQKEGYNVDVKTLQYDIFATVHSLKKYLKGRMAH